MSQDKPVDILENAPNELIEAVRNKKALFIVGAGVSIAATGGAGCASWVGLLESGLDYLTKPPFNFDNSWKSTKLAALNSNDPDEMIGVAELVRRKLTTGTGSGHLKTWLSQTIGQLQVRHSDLLTAITASKCPIATTNYDDLLCQFAGLRPYTWQDPDNIHEILRGTKRGVIHLHGHFDSVESVILGYTDYAKVTDGATVFQEIQKYMAGDHTLVFVGCGAGTADPNIGGLLRWIAKIYGNGIYQHYRLELEGGFKQVQTEHDAAGHNVTVIPYGTQHNDLPTFINALAGTPSAAKPARAQAPKAQVTQKQHLDTIEQRLIKAQRGTYRPISVGQNANPLNLERCYVQLNLWPGEAHCDLDKRVKERLALEMGDRSAQRALNKTERLHPYEAIAKNQTLVVLGDPGSGKTTLLLHLLNSDEACRNAAKLNQSPHFPIFVRLRQLENKPLETQFLETLSQLSDGTQTIDIKTAYNRAKKEGRLLLLLDGMDEVKKQHRLALTRRIDSFSNALITTHSGNRVLVTCRVLPYVAPYRLERCESRVYQVAPFTDDDIQGFIHNHFQDGDTALATDLWQRLNAHHSRVNSLARTPLLLALLCRYFEENKNLPERRVELYEKIVRQLLRDERGKTPTEALADDKVPILLEVAYRSFADGQRPTSRGQLLKLIAQKKLISIHDSEVVPAPTVLNEIIHRSGLLVPLDDDNLVFMHLTFQEYFVAQYLNENERWQTAVQQHGSDSRWAEVWRLLATLMKDAGPLVELLATNGAKVELFSAIAHEADLIGWDSIEALHPTTAANSHGSEPPITRAGAVLLAQLQQPDLPISVAFDRLEQRYTWATLRDFYGQLLAADRNLHKSEGKRLDPALMYVAHVHLTHAMTQQRQGASDIAKWLKAWRGPELPDEGFKNIGKATFTMGEANKQQILPAPSHSVNLGAYAMAIHPVTNSELEQYDPSHLNARRFTDKVKAQELAKHPVVKVSWYEAYLYSAWRGCTLPTEAQWEYAARGQEGLTYPWGHEKPTHELANYNPKVGHTTPVGSYPKGVSWCGLHDIAGNVEEWCTDWAANYPESTTAPIDPLGPSNGSYRVVRGGSWVIGVRGLRGAVRNGRRPGDRSGGVGFRLASRSR